MANFQVSIQGDELNELVDIITSINAENQGEVITPGQFLTNVCMNYLTPRIRDVLIHEARTAPLDELKQKLGAIASLKTKQKNRSK